MMVLAAITLTLWAIGVIRVADQINIQPATKREARMIFYGTLILTIIMGGVAIWAFSTLL